MLLFLYFFFFSSRRRHTRCLSDWSSDVCSSDLVNAVQYDLLKRLAAPHGNFFAVGDDEQSIFTWTGADPYVLVRFSRDYERSEERRVGKERRSRWGPQS